MIIYDAVRIRPFELRQLEASVGGKFSIAERLRLGGIGSPMVYYLNGLSELDELQTVSNDEIRVNLELFKAGIFLRVAERTNPYFIPIPIGDIVAVTLFKSKEQTRLNLLFAEGEQLKFWSHPAEFDGWDRFLRGNFLEAKRTFLEG